MTEWRPLKGWEDAYEITPDGQIRSTRTGRILKPRHGQVTLSRNGKQQLRSVRLLTEETYSGTPAPASQYEYPDDIREFTDRMLQHLRRIQQEIRNGSPRPSRAEP